MEANLINNLKLLHQVIVIKFPEGDLERCPTFQLIPTFFKRYDIFIYWNLLIELGWLATKFQGFSYILFPSTGGYSHVAPQSTVIGI